MRGKVSVYIALILTLLILVPHTAKAITVIAPKEVFPGDTYTISVLIQPNETGLLTIQGAAFLIAEINFTADLSGQFVYRSAAPRVEGTLTLQIVASRSGSWSGSLAVISPQCTTTNAPSCLAFLGPQLQELGMELATLLGLLILIINGPNIILGLGRYRKIAKLEGGPSLRELAKSPLAFGYAIVQPGRMTPKVLPNSRLALDLKRREKIVELITVARHARKYDYDRVLALVRKTREVVDAYNLERSVLKRPSMEAK